MPAAGGGDRAPLRFDVVLGAIALAAAVIRIAFVLLVDPTVPRIGDASAYHLLGEGLARGDGYIRPFDHLLLHVQRPTAEYPPLFAVLLAVPARLGIHSVDAQRIFVSLIGAGTVVLIGLLGRRVGGDAVGLVSAALAAVYPMLFLSEAILMAEALYAPLVVLTLLCAYRAYDEPSVGRFVVLGVVIGATTLTRAEGLLLGIIVLLGLAVRVPNQATRTRLAHAGIGFGVAIAVLLPWTIRNAAEFGTFVPVSNNLATLVDGANCDATYSGAYLGQWRESFSTFGDVARTLPQAQACFEGFDIANPDFDEAEVARKHRADGIDYATDHVGDWPKVVGTRVLRTWAVSSPGRQVNFEALEGRPREWQMRGTVMYWILALLAIAGAVLLVRRRVFLWPLFATVITVTLVAAVTYGQQRFRIAAEPAVLVFAAAAMTGFGGLRRPNRSSDAAKT
jgi:hypothetical protein